MIAMILLLVLARARAYVTVMSVCLSVCPSVRLSVRLCICTAQTTGPVDIKFGPHMHIYHGLDKFEDGFDQTSGG